MCLTYRVVYLLATLREAKTAPSSPFAISMDVTLTGFQNAEHQCVCIFSQHIKIEERPDLSGDWTCTLGVWGRNPALLVYIVASSIH